MWHVVLSKEFESWFEQQPEKTQDDFLHYLRLLQEFGPHLSRPYAGVIYGSSFSNLKELRVQSLGKPYRALFVFDPKRQAVVLCAGNKSGNEKRFYKQMIPLAEKIYQRYLQEFSDGNF